MVNDVKFSPDDQWLASGGFDHTVRVWEATPPTAARRRQREAAALVNRLAAEALIEGKATEPQK
jgi:WD40 repeat protein